MSSGKKRERVREFLTAPFQRHKSGSRSPSPSPASSLIPGPALSDTPANTPNATLLSDDISGSSSTTDKGFGSTVLATGDQPPNPQSPATPIKSGAFQKAIQEYMDNLSDDDKAAFQSATDVMEKIGELQQGKSRTPSSPTRMQKVQNVLQCVKKFLGTVAICIQQNPEITSLVVGGLNCILTVGAYP